MARTTQCVLLKAAEEAVLPVEVEVVAEVVAEGVVVVVAGEVAGVVRAKEVEGAGDENAAVGAEFGVAREVVVVLADAVAGVKVAVVELVVEAVAAVSCGEEGAVVFAVVTPAEARSALRRGVAAVIGQRAAEGVHFSFLWLGFLRTEKVQNDGAGALPLRVIFEHSFNLRTEHHS